MPPTVFTPYILLEPLIAAGLIALFLRRRGNWAAGLSLFAALMIAIRAVKMALSGARFDSLPVEWLRVRTFCFSLGYTYDDLAALMQCVVGLVGLCIRVFALGYMPHAEAKARFFGGLSIFMFSMVGI